MYSEQYNYMFRYLINGLNNAAGKREKQEKKGIFEYSKTEEKPYKGTGRNEKCPCGSGKKYKHCCGG